nr:MAG TPA: hypothetical protein [Caudoviricetes sp.]DAQ60997.1 MAG TPA: hypothetical protein [Bacteriophage sp.]DAV80904.1 MAG TPA: hypothetical protein [Caudoviricetes sp.]
MIYKSVQVLTSLDVCFVQKQNRIKVCFYNYIINLRICNM